MPADNEPNGIICMPWSQITVAVSERVICSKCEEICGLSPATKAQASKHGPYIIICINCFKKDFTGKEEIMPPTHAQMEELRDATEDPDF